MEESNDTPIQGSDTPNVNLTSAEEVSSSKKNKKESKVWEYYTKLANGRVKCMFCPKDYAYNSDHGTTTLWKHLREKCIKSPLFRKPFKLEKQQSLLAFKDVNDPTSGGKKRDLVTHVFDNEMCRQSLIEMVVIDELSFKFVEGMGFRSFYRRNLPQFTIPSRWTVARDCLKLYQEERLKLKYKFASGVQRVCFTTDAWTSIQMSSYMCLTAHFIDENWQYQKRLINFCQLSDHKGETIGKTIESCLLEWGIDNVFTLTVDNASSNDVVVAYIKKRLKNWKVELVNGDHLHVRCGAHILNLIVNDGLKNLHNSIVCIRNAIRYVRSSPSRIVKFKECAEKEKLPVNALLCLDVPTRWNSTYLMLESACKFQKAFERMEEDDGHYKIHFIENQREGPPAYNDWENAKIFVSVLKVFYEVTLRLSASKFVTSSGFLQDIAAVNDAICQLCDCGDSFLRDMGYKMRMKFDKYWGDPKKFNYYLFVAVLLDPRLKLSFLKWSFDDLYGTEISKEMMISVRQFTDSLFKEYEVKEGGIDTYRSDGSCVKNQPSMTKMDLHSDHRSIKFRQFQKAMNAQNIEGMKTEVERYLTEERITDDSVDFDVLTWWKLNSHRFKILSQIAKDVLAIPVSTVASESAFSSGGRILDQFRSSLTPKMVEALLCAEDWLKCSNAFTELDPDEFIKEVAHWIEMDIGGEFNKDKPINSSAPASYSSVAQ